MAAALNPAQQDFRNCLANVLGFTARQVTTLVADGYDTADDIIHWNFSDITKWCSAKTSLQILRGGCTYGDLRVKNLQGLAWWCTDRSLRGKQIDVATDFNAAILIDSRDEARLEHDESKVESTLKKPEIFSSEKWVDWAESVYNYFSGTKNTKGIPYSYVIRKEPCPIPAVAMSNEEEKIYHATLAGNLFNRDNRHVFQILKELTVGTEAETWTKKKKGGREVMLALQGHYNGKAEGERRKAVAKSDIEKLFYRNESTFLFEKYVTKLQHAFNILEQYAIPEFEENKIKLLLDKVTCPNQELKSEVILCRSTQHTFIDAATYMQTAVSCIFPNCQPSSNRYSKRRREINAYGRGRGGRGRGRGGRGGRGGRSGYNKPSGKTENGVDISDVTRWYSDQEFSSLSPDTRKYILQHEDRKAAIASRKRAKVSSTAISGDTENRLVASMITGVMNAQSAQSVQRNPGGVRYTLNGNSTIGSTT